MGIWDTIKKASAAAVRAVTNPVNTLKNVVTAPVAIVNRIVDTANSLDEMPEKIKELLRNNGKDHVRSLTIFREPVNPLVVAATKVVTIGRLKTPIRHVFEVFQLGIPGRGDIYVRIEKNEIVETSEISKQQYNALQRTHEHKILTPFGWTLDTYFSNYSRKTNPKMLWLYDPLTANCQVFVYLGLITNDYPVTKELEDWIVQKGVKTEISSTSHSIMKGITTLANFGRRFAGASGEMYGSRENFILADMLNEHAELVYAWAAMQKDIHELMRSDFKRLRE